MKVISIDGVDYVKKEDSKESAQDLRGMKYVIVRTYSAGVFAGYLHVRKGKEVSLVNARRLWKWAGAASLSQLAVDGTKEPSSCKFPCEVSNIDLTEAIEILDVTAKSQKSIAEVAIWKI